MVEGEFSITLNSHFVKKDVRKAFTKATEHALLKVAERLLSDSRVYVPVLTGALKASGHIEELPTLENATKLIRVIYNLDYAEKQHENEYRHPSLGFYGAAKYLQKPLTLYGAYYMELFTFEFDAYASEHGLA